MGRTRILVWPLPRLKWRLSHLFLWKEMFFLVLRIRIKRKLWRLQRSLSELGFSFTSTEGTAKFLNENGIKAESTLRISEGRPNVADLIKNGKVQLVINTPLGLIPRRDENGIRQEAVAHSVPVITTLGSAYAAQEGIRSLKGPEVFLSSHCRITPKRTNFYFLWNARL